MKVSIRTQVRTWVVGVIAAVAALAANTVLGADKPAAVQPSPVTAFKDGFTLEQSKKFRNEFLLRKA